MKPDPQIPTSFVRNFLEANPSYTPGHNEETDALFNPSIVAEPAHVPQAMRIKEVKRTEYFFYWAFDRDGLNPDHTRVGQLRSAGFQFATTDDVEMCIDDTVKGRDEKNFSSEIRNGDNRLMKVKKRRWLEIRKDQQLRALLMANPRGKAMGEDGSVMGVQNLIPGVKTTVTEQPGTLSAAAAFSDAAKDVAAVAQGGQAAGNASKISSESVNRGASQRPSAGRGAE
jgi:hypothetical protein